MALTETQRTQVRLYCGWPARFWQMDSRLEQAMNAVDGKAEEVALVVTLLASLADIDTRLTTTYTRLKAAKLGDITLPGDTEVGVLRSEGRRFSGRLCALLGVDYRHDVWSGSGPQQYATTDGMFGGGHYVRQG